MYLHIDWLEECPITLLPLQRTLGQLPYPNTRVGAHMNDRHLNKLNQESYSKVH